MAIAADIRRRLRRIEVAIDMKQAEAAPGPLGNDIRGAAALGGRIGDVKEKGGHGVAFGRRKRARLTLVIDSFVSSQPHRRSESAIDEVANGARGISSIAVGGDTPMNARGIDPAVGITGDPVPMKRGGVAKSPAGHRRAGHDLIAPGDDRRVEHPEEMIGVAVGMATGTGKRLRRRGGGRVEGNFSKAKRLGRRIGKGNRRHRCRMLPIGEIDERHFIGECRQHPGPHRRPAGIALEHHAVGPEAHRHAAEDRATGHVKSEEHS